MDRSRTETSHESEVLEFKADVSSEKRSWLKTVVAFANESGGRLVFGIEDATRRASGIAAYDARQKADQITNIIADACSPRIPFTVTIEDADGNSLIFVDVSKGVEKPYFITAEGPVKGVYVRVGSTTRQAEAYLVQTMILETRRMSFDQLETEKVVTDAEVTRLCRHLTLRSAQSAESLGRPAKPAITASQLLSFGLIHKHGDTWRAANGFWLFTDPQPRFPQAEIRCALFKGTDRSVFLDRRIISGPLHEQIDTACSFVLSHIECRVTFEGTKRIDTFELPEMSIRELITNALCHRSYLCQDPVYVNLYDDRLEITSPGTLATGLTVKDVIDGQSRIQNQGIAAILDYLGMMERWGSGIPRLIRECRDYGLKPPVLKEIGRGFMVTVFRQKAEAAAVSDMLTTQPQARTAAEFPVTSEPERTPATLRLQAKLLAWFKRHPKTQLNDAAQALGISLPYVRVLTKRLKDAGLLTRTGARKLSTWHVRETRIKR